ncbi:hypothetical protein [Geomonas sp.]|uniref:hypothetical protein n=1 Tax=Geomonas sp. TaxID=2651584 RepID=UPI002B47498B|nr:hypothetical protein [Geomonas sp.]HJV35558.1 hypothetical protein [Geomonas sp.]
MEGSDELLRMEITELHAFARHHLQLYLTWYTFFLTVNFAAIGWFTSVLLTGALKVSLPVVYIAAFFIIQIIFSYLGSVEVRKYFESVHDRCQEIFSSIHIQYSGSQVQAKPAIPLDVYVKIIRLICYTLISFSFFWTALAIVSIHLVPL